MITILRRDNLSIVVRFLHVIALSHFNWFSLPENSRPESARLLISDVGAYSRNDNNFMGHGSLYVGSSDEFSHVVLSAFYFCSTFMAVVQIPADASRREL